ncbi:hypothetical protein ACFSEO_05960 [Agromyces cerinus subsp. nitratus]
MPQRAPARSIRHAGAGVSARLPSGATGRGCGSRPSIRSSRQA